MEKNNTKPPTSPPATNVRALEFIDVADCHHKVSFLFKIFFVLKLLVMEIVLKRIPC